MINNSSIIILAFFGFTVFGYLTLLRIVSRQYFPSSSVAKAFTCAFKDGRVLANLGSSALFISLPATSLLLFWGWAPALIWLLVVHLFIDSIFHLQVSAAEQISIESTALVRGQSSATRFLEFSVVQSFYTLLTAVVLTLLAGLIDRQSGLLFALICLLPAHQLLRGEAGLNWFRGFAALLVLTIGITFAHQLGFAIYGSWSPFEGIAPGYLDWLVFDNQTLIAAGLLIGATQLSKNLSFEKDFATLSGFLLVCFILFLGIRLGWLQPTLDAPLNAQNELGEDAGYALPAFLSLALLLFWSLGGLIMRLTNERDGLNKQGEISSRFGRLQWESSLQLLFSLVLLLSLASAFGIGAWNTHYAESPLGQDIAQHFAFAISAISALADMTDRAGTIFNTLFLAGFAITGFSFLVACTQRMGLDWSATKAMDSKSSVAQAIIAFLLACVFFQHGIHIDVWIFLGALAWIMFTHHALGACVAVQGLRPGAANGLFANCAVLVVAMLGL
ncbi:MAG: hypothetical protein AAF197_11640, partial [Pseudomonadota bacterium]